MVGFQYIKKESDGIEKHSLCNQLRGSSIQAILSLFLPYAAYYQMAKYLPTVIPWTSLVGLAGVFSPTNTWRSVIQFYIFCCMMTMDARLALQVTSYILFTEKILSMDHKNLLSAMYWVDTMASWTIHPYERHNRIEYVESNRCEALQAPTVTPNKNAVRSKKSACKDTPYDPMVYLSKVTQTWIRQEDTNPLLNSCSEGG
jgi:hypothetical protein